MFPYLGSTGIRLYDFIGMLSFIIATIFNLTQIKYKKLFLGKFSLSSIKYFSKKPSFASSFLTNQTFWSATETVLVSIVQLALIGIINFGFGDLVGTGANYFGLLFSAPLTILFICRLLGIDYIKQFDLITPAFPVALTFAKLACFCQGCCHGIVCSFGLYNHKTNLIEFPVQLVEMSLAILIFIFLMIWRKKAKEGTMFPTYMIVYSSTRFFSEFLRCEPDIIFKLKTYHILCLIGIAVGSAEMYIALKHKDRFRVAYERSFDFTRALRDKVLIKLNIKREKNIIHHKSRKKKK